MLSTCKRSMAFLAWAMLLTACGGGGGSGGNPAAPPTTTPPPAPAPAPPPDDGVAATFAYIPTSPYASTMTDCTYRGDNTLACTLDTLPFLGQDVLDPTIDDILGRTIVSHTWMGDNFRDLLAAMPADMRALFRSITAVVIADDVRPAHYKPTTGAIYLDPEFIWLDPTEEADITAGPDPRSEFGLDLQFKMPWRYTRNGERLSLFLNADGSRPADQLAVITAFLLYHELAHAADFMHPSRLAGLPTNRTVEQSLSQDTLMSEAFKMAYPLTSATLTELAAVSFLGEDSTAQQRALLPDDLIDEFANDGAIQYYAYTSQFEDFAGLFETVMLSYHYDLDKDTAITDVPASGDTNDAIVAWGQRGRFADQNVILRALAVVQAIYPGNLATIEDYITGTPAPIQMRVGDTWAENLDLGAQITQAAGSAIVIDKRRADPILERVFIR